jgi:hypothetical protein
LKSAWPPRSISADFTLWFEGILDCNRIFSVLRSLDNSVYVKAKNGGVHPKSLNSKVDGNVKVIMLVT